MALLSLPPPPSTPICLTKSYIFILETRNQGWEISLNILETRNQGGEISLNILETRHQGGEIRLNN